MHVNEERLLRTAPLQVYDWACTKGWEPDDERTFAAECALMHSEVSEALEAFRDHGLEDMTLLDTGSKPEGVGSEYADLFIRLVHYAHIHHVSLYGAVMDFSGLFGIELDFASQINTLHHHIDHLYRQWESGTGLLAISFARIYVYLKQLCDHHGIDLLFEYERKMAYNKIREYRHGGKRI